MQGAGGGLRLPQGCPPSLVTVELGGVAVARLTRLHQIEEQGQLGGGIPAPGEEQRYCNVVGSCSREDQVVEVGAGLGLLHRDRVLVARPGQEEVGLGVRVVVRPSSPEDWAVLSLNRRRVEREVLDQVRVVSPGQVLRLSVDQVPLCLTVASVEPARRAVVLQQMTEMVIDVPDSFAEEEEEEEQSGTLGSGWREDPHPAPPAPPAPPPPPSLLSRLASLLFSHEQENSQELEEQEVLRAEHSRERVRGELRLHQGEVAGYTCTVAASSLPGAPPVFLATLTPIPHSSTSATSATSPTPVVVRVEVSHSEEVEEGRLYVSSTLLRWRGLPLTSRVLVESVDLLPSHLSHLTREVVVVGREGEEVARDTGAQPSLWPAGCAMAAGDRLLQVETVDCGWQWAPPHTPIVVRRTQGDQVEEQVVERPCVEQEVEVVEGVWGDTLGTCVKYLGSGRPAHLLLTGALGSGRATIARWRGSCGGCGGWPAGSCTATPSGGGRGRW